MQFLILILGSISLILTLFSQVATADWLEKSTELLEQVPQILQEVQGHQNKTGSTANSLFSNQELEKAFREALSISANKVVGQLSLTDGFNADPNIHIPLPKSLTKVESVLKRVGLENYTQELEVRLNRAAEAAMPEAKVIFLDAIKSMTFKDVQQIYQGDNKAATQYLQKTTSPALKAKLLPHIEQSLS